MLLMLRLTNKPLKHKLLFKPNKLPSLQQNKLYLKRGTLLMPPLVQLQQLLKMMSPPPLGVLIKLLSSLTQSLKRQLKLKLMPLLLSKPLMMPRQKLMNK